MSNTRETATFKVKCNDKEIDETSLISFRVVQDMGQADMCEIIVRNDANQLTGAWEQAAKVTIEADGKEVFSGELVGLEPQYVAEQKSTLAIRAFNKMHRLLRGRMSRTFTNMTDAQIADKVARDKKLKCEAGTTEPTHDHVYQRNQTDFEFLLARAQRVGFAVWVEGDTLHFDTPEIAGKPAATLKYGAAEDEETLFLKRFTPKVSSAHVVSEVEVRGWDPIKKQEIVGVAKAEGTPLGGKSAHQAAGGFQGVKTYSVNHPVRDQKEAEQIAKSILSDSMMGFMTGSGECRGSPEIKPGVVIEITVNPDDANDRFNGKYYVTGASHIYDNSDGAEGGYVTAFQVRRDAEGGG